MSVPFFVHQAYGLSNLSEPNIITHFYSSTNIENLDNDIIEKLALHIYEFCSDEYGCGITIDDYNDFCNKYWKNSEFGCCIKYYEYVFEIYYFANNEWFNWDINNHKMEIFDAYVCFKNYRKQINA